MIVATCISIKSDYCIRFEKAFAATSGSSNWSKILLAAEIINPWKYTSMTLVMKV